MRINVCFHSTSKIFRRLKTVCIVHLLQFNRKNFFCSIVNVQTKQNQINSSFKWRRRWWYVNRAPSYIRHILFISFVFLSCRFAWLKLNWMKGNFNWCRNIKNGILINSFDNDCPFFFSVVCFAFLKSFRHRLKCVRLFWV